MNALKLSLEKENEPVFTRSYRTIEWKSVYEERFQNYDHKRNEKIEKRQKEKEEFEKTKEEEVIKMRHSHSRKPHSMAISQTFDRLYHQAEVYKIKKEQLKKDYEQDALESEMRKKSPTKKKKKAFASPQKKTKEKHLKPPPAKKLTGDQEILKKKKISPAKHQKKSKVAGAEEKLLCIKNINQIVEFTSDVSAKTVNAEVNGTMKVNDLRLGVIKDKSKNFKSKHINDYNAGKIVESLFQINN